MSKLSELFHKSKTLEPDSIEECYIKELESEKAELIEGLKEIENSNSVRWIQYKAEELLNKYKDGE